VAGIIALTAATLAGTPAQATPAPPAAEPAQPVKALTTEQALAQAVSTGKTGAVDGATTSTDTVTANPDGTIALTRAAMPVRKMVGGSWHDLDATLVRDPDGTIHPANTTYGLKLSAGGTGPLAVMDNTGHSLAVSAPMTLPTPALSGGVATYSNVLPGVDLQVHADLQGGFTHVFVIHNAAAAANPALQTITMGVRTDGVTVAADAHQSLAAVDRYGREIFTAPAPRMWDSANPANGAAPSVSAQANAITGADTSHDAAVGVAVQSGSIVLTPDQNLLSATSTVYPVYVDPGWSSLGATKSGWATVAEPYPTSKYWNNTPDPNGLMQVGNSGTMWSHTLINMPIKTSTLSDATIKSATLNITEVYAYSCTPSKVNIYAPVQTLTSSNAYWDAWDGKLGSAIDSATVAHGYNSSCPAAAVGFNVTSAVTADVAAGRTTQTFGLAGASEDSDGSSWKKFSPSSPTMTIIYNHTPNKPTGLSTSPSTACTAASPTVIGDGAVKLYAPVSDPDGGALGVSFTVYKSSDLTTPIATSDSSKLTYPSGSTAVFTLAKATLEAASSGVTAFTWKVRVTDTVAWSVWSTSCKFSFDETRPGTPNIDQPADGTQIGTAFSLPIAAPDGGTVPTSYLYQLNGAAPKTVTASAGAASISVTPTRFTNVLTVTSVSAGGNIGTEANVVFNSTPAATAADQDLTGDSIPDLLTVGNAGGVPAGLWMAQGQAGSGHTTGTGQVITAAVNLGANGSHVSGTATTPASFNSAQAITGTFTGTGLQDVLAYYPTGANAGMAAILNGSGDGSPIQSQLSNNQTTIWAGTLSDWNSDNPLQLVNAGNSSGRGLAYPDLLGTSGDSTNGYYLTYYPNSALVGGYAEVDPLTTLTPTGGTDWNTWTLASAQMSTGTSLYLWQKTTGALYLWTNLAYSVDDWSIAYTQTALGTWNANAAITLQAADVDGNGTADLWTVGAGGVATAWLNTGTTVATAPAQILITSTHTWLLNEGDGADTDDDAIATAADSTGALAATGNSGVTWHTGGLFSPDATFNGTTGVLAASGPALNTNADFTISVWAKAKANSGYLLSQDGSLTTSSSHASGFVLYTGSNNNWYFGMSQANSATAPAYDLVTDPEGPVRYGAWQHITATYNKTTGTMALYVDGNPSGTKAHTTAWNATGKFQIGDYLNNNAHTGYFNGEVADAQVWNQTLTPNQVAKLSGTPGYILFPSDNTNYVSGSSWTTPCAKMTFSQGKLSITQTCTESSTVTYGTTGYPDAVLVLQTDGNLVIYKTSTATHTSANSLWSSVTSPNPGDTMFFQPDGNLVIYAATGAPVWASGTDNN